jgi:hypothetical protein
MIDSKNENKQTSHMKKRWLSDKPFWIRWIAYTILTAVLFGLGYLGMQILTDFWWALGIFIIFFGLVLGWYAKNKQNITYNITGLPTIL